MVNSATRLTIFTLFLGLILSSCGRKQRNIFFFPEKEPVRINKLSLPVVRGLSAQLSDKKIMVSWLPIDATTTLPDHISFVGYSVFRLTKGYFVPKQPIHKQPITTTFYSDGNLPKKDFSFCYMVRTVFMINDQISYGPASNIVCVSNKK